MTTLGDVLFSEEFLFEGEKIKDCIKNKENSIKNKKSNKKNSKNNNEGDLDVDNDLSNKKKKNIKESTIFNNIELI